MSETTHAEQAEHDHGHGMGHVMPLPMLFGVFAALMILTVLTVTAADLGLGSWDIFVSMTIATIKAVLVATVFMHLMYDKPLNIMIFLFSLVFVGLFIGATLIDTNQYQDEIRPVWVEDILKQSEAPAAGEAPAEPMPAPAN